MRLTIRLLGTELLHIEAGRDCEQGKPDRSSLEANDGGSFEMGFVPSVTWSPTERDAEGP
jgi:hypothetical protein